MQIVTGNPDPLGFSIRDKEANFALFASHAEKVTLVLFQNGHPINHIPMNRSGDIWHVGIVDLPENLEYMVQCMGPKENHYKPDAWLIDPYAKIVHSGKALAKEPAHFEWQNDHLPQIPKENLIIYEMHVRGFTKHSSSKVSHPGTYLGLIEKIPYLKKLGINAVELMPIFGFDPNYLKRVSQKDHLVNYWGYSPLYYFSPMNLYADKDPIDEFKTLVRELHKNGIEVILDVVFNHTGEDNDLNYYISFRGIDNSVYYLLDQQGQYLNYSGCWNTINSNHPAVQKWILDCLRYWADEMHVDGFRFDLASIHTRDTNGNPIDNAPILKAIQADPILSKRKLIAEPWDAAGLYQLGQFPNWGPWSEWNGQYRDIVRKFIKGTDNYAGSFANVISGSETTYGSSNTPLSSINFITAHDGYSLRDLVSYQKKYNFANGENNRDGNDANYSWNCGAEGETNDPNVKNLRERQMRNFLLALFLSQGIPMLLMGDEYGHTRKGNNNPYVQDNELNWFLWDEIDEKKLEFISSLIAFRQKHPILRRKEFLKDEDVSWFSSWEPNERLVAYQLKGAPSLYIAFNARPDPVKLTLPEGKWHLVTNTADDWQFQKKDSTISFIELIPHSSCIAVQE